MRSALRPQARGLPLPPHSKSSLAVPTRTYGGCARRWSTRIQLTTSPRRRSFALAPRFIASVAVRAAARGSLRSLATCAWTSFARDIAVDAATSAWRPPRIAPKQPIPPARSRRENYWRSLTRTGAARLCSRRSFASPTRRPRRSAAARRSLSCLRVARARDDLITLMQGDRTGPRKPRVHDDRRAQGTGANL